MSTGALAVIIVTVIGILCAVMLSVASKVMAVKEDPLIPLVRECLPGANCGACGYAGCNGYAQALVEDPEMELTKCTPGGENVAKALSQVLGRKAGKMVLMTAVIGCRGDNSKTARKMQYDGIKTCSAANMMFGGTGQCQYGCLGLGDCARGCPHGAIVIRDGLAHVIDEKCVACGLCTKTCPKGLIYIQPYYEPVRVLCSNHEKGAVVRKECSIGCIACGLCVKNCPVDAIKIENNLAVIDTEECIGCGACRIVCPVKVIIGSGHGNE
ncbi:MAG: RnfABCDGE type electron transport complex subunit B [Firmicutes bacterium]|nr:RnfABCDGE type electron transport complex subunit B [Bacillota bacterium]